MQAIGIMANGPANHLPDLTRYQAEIDLWIGVDYGALTLLENGISVNHAVGDFDSINDRQRANLFESVTYIDTYPTEKEATDLEIAIQQAMKHNPEKIYLFGVTGGRMDHTLINMQLLHKIIGENIRGIIVDRWNKVELTMPGTYQVSNDEHYPYVSFVPFTESVRNLSLVGFYYPLDNYELLWGASRCISNELIRNEGNFTYDKGMLLVIQSRDV